MNNTDYLTAILIGGPADGMAHRLIGIELEYITVPYTNEPHYVYFDPVTPEAYNEGPYRIARYKYAPIFLEAMPIEEFSKVRIYYFVREPECTT